MQASRELAIFLKPYWRSAILAPLLMVLEVTMDLLQPRLIQRIVDQGIARSDLTVVLNTGLLMVACAVAGLVGGMGCTVFAVLAAQGFGANLRGTLFRKVQSLSFGNLDRLETGKLVTRLTSDVSQVQDVVMMLLRVMVRVPLLLIGSLIMAILTSPRLALLFVVLIPLVVVTIFWIIGRTFPMYSQVQARLDALNTVMQENLAGVRVVKAFARASQEIQRFRGANDRLMEQNIGVVRVGAVTMPVMMLTVNLGVVGAIWFGGLEVDRGGLEVGQLIAFINYLGQTLMSLMTVSMLTVRISRAAASSERIKEVLDSEPELRTSPNARTDFAPRGRVSFRGGQFPVSRRRTGSGPSRDRLCRRAGRDGRGARRDRRWEVEPGQPDSPILRRHGGEGEQSTASTCATWTRASSARTSALPCKRQCSSAARFATTFATDDRPPATPR